MYIKFHTTKYELLDNPNISSSRFQATIIKGDNSFDSIIADTVDVENITVYDGEEVKAIYSGYDKRIAISIQTDDSISIELENSDIQSQIDIISANLITQQSQIENISDSVDELNNTVETITPYTAEKAGYVGDTEVLFEDVPDGIITVSAENSEGNSIECEAKKSGNDVVVTFEPLEYVTTISISIS